ncbi:MAG: hypothetical protein IKZ72_03185 [Bacteroidales bacterium]|nr:hypothetical protein [Bacteroidales bacterium]
MMYGRDLKRLIDMIPPDAIVTINGNRDVDIESVTVETAPFGGMDATLHLTKGFQLCKDEFMDDLFEKLKSRT